MTGPVMTLLSIATWSTDVEAAHQLGKCLCPPRLVAMYKGKPMNWWIINMTIV